jgi:hypothetical protein
LEGFFVSGKACLRYSGTVRIRTFYFKVKNMPAAAEFWRSFLDVQPSKASARWTQFEVGGMNLALILNDFDEGVRGSNGVPVFEVEDAQVESSVISAKSLGAKVVFDGLKDPDVLSVVLSDPAGNEFEISKKH